MKGNFKNRAISRRIKLSRLYVLLWFFVLLIVTIFALLTVFLWAYKDALDVQVPNCRVISCIEKEVMNVFPVRGEDEQKIFDFVKEFMLSFGLFTFIFESFNAAQRETVKGLPLRTVLYAKYPGYQFVYMLNAFFLLNGFVACSNQNKWVCVISFFGFFISSLMCFHVVYRAQVANPGILAQKYLEIILAKKRMTSKRREDCERALHDICSYCSGKLDKYGISVVWSFPSSKEMPLPGQTPTVKKWWSALKKRIQGKKRESLQAEIANLEVEYILRLARKTAQIEEGSFLNFESIYLNGAEEDTQDKLIEAVLYQMPYFDQPHKKFQSALTVYAGMWEELLHQVTDQKRQAEIVFSILYDARSREFVVPLWCGLIVYLHQQFFDPNTNANEEDWEQLASFMARVGQKIRRMEMVAEDCSRVSHCYQYMLKTMWILGALEQECSSNPVPYRPIEALAQLSIHRFRWSYQMRLQSRVQLCYAIDILQVLSLHYLADLYYDDIKTVEEKLALESQREKL